MLSELSPCDREDIAHKAEVISYLALHRKSLPIHILEESPFNIIYAPVIPNPIRVEENGKCWAFFTPGM